MNTAIATRLKRAARLARNFTIPAATIIACAIVRFGYPHHDYWRTVIWAGVVFGSAIGWGSALGELLFLDGPPLGWGLEAALGLAIHLAIGGTLAMVSLVSPTTVFAMVAIGVVLLAVVGWRRDRRPVDASPRRRRTSFADAAVIVIFLGIAVLHFLGMSGIRWANVWDDYEAYFTYPKQLLATGSLIEPFSLRRLATYGGQSYLHAILLVFTPSVLRLGVLDNGIGFLVLGGLAIGWVGERPRLRLITVAPALIGLVALAHTPHNSASELSGAVFFMAAFRILDRERAVAADPRAHAFAFALCTMAACTLRQTNLIPAAAIPACWYGLQLVREKDARPRWAREALFMGIFTAALMLPWMILSYRSGRTFLFPAFHGNGVKEFGLFEPITPVEQAKFFVACTLFAGTMPGMLFVFLAGLFVPGRRTSEALRAHLAGVAIGAILLFISLAAADDLSSTARYFMPSQLGYYLSACLVVAGAASGSTRPGALRSRGWVRGDAMIGFAFVAAALVLEVSAGRDTLRTIYLTDIDVINREGRLSYVPSPEPADGTYRAIQQSVPEHEKLLVMLDEPFRLDYRRNHIVAFDQPGSASPKPHLPIGKGPEALAEYLLSQGIRYVAFHLGPPSPEYAVGNWDGKLKGAVPPRDMQSRGVQLRAIARFYVDIFTNFDKLAASRKQLYSQGGTTVMDLATPR